MFPTSANRIVYAANLGNGIVQRTRLIRRVFTPAEIRTLFSAPVDFAIPANGNTFLLPGECTFVGALGTVAYSAPPAPYLQYSDAGGNAGLDASSAWDGTVRAYSVLVTPTGSIYSNPSNAVDIVTQLGLRLQIASGADVTGGDAPCSVRMYVTEYDFTAEL